MMDYRAIGLSVILTVIIIIGMIGDTIGAIPDIAEFEKNMNRQGEQTALTGDIDSLVITRPNVEFRLGPGKISLLDFGASRPCAMVYEGKGWFRYTPPNEIEKGQLVKFTDKEILDEELTSAVFVYTMELDNFPDTSGFKRTTIGRKTRDLLSDTVEDAFERMDIYLPNKVIGDLLTEFPGFYFYADFDLAKIGHLVFREDSAHADQYRLYKLRKIVGADDADVLGGYSPDNKLPSQRGIGMVDIINYKIESKLEGSGKMYVKCRIEYTPLRWGYSFLYFDWYYENKDISAFDSNGDSLLVIHRKNERGVGIIPKSPLEFGKSDYIDINYECKSLKSVYGLIYVFGKTSWFPSNPVLDRATFELSYDIPKSYQIVSCGKQLEQTEENGRHISRWAVDKPVQYVSFNLGVFESKETIVDGYPPVKVFMSKQIDHNAIALYNAYFGNLSSSDMIGQVSADVTNSLAFYTSVFGPCPFDTIKATEIPSTGEGQGSPGLIHLTWSTFQSDDMQGYSESFRAHEVAHQWWGHVIDYESYRDVWITEGLADYSGLWFYELSAKNKKAVNNMLQFYRQLIFSGSGAREVGSKAGPMTIGYRLSSSKSSDYMNIVYYKGAYIFHMIRYLLHDYKTGSDDAFAAFLKDLADSYKGKIITTPLLQKLLEKHIGAEMGWFFDQWVYGTAIPEYEFSYQSAPTDDGKYSVVCHVVQKEVPDNFGMLVPITVVFEGDQYIHLKLWIDMAEADVDLPILPFEPKKIIFNTFDAVLCKVEYK